MKHKLLRTLPEVFSLRPNSDYGRFVTKGGAVQMMRDTWLQVGRRLEQSAVKVGRDVKPKKRAA